jgi:hypothetical protein
MGHKQLANRKRKHQAKAAAKQAALKINEEIGLEGAPIMEPEIILKDKNTRRKMRRWGFDVFITRDIPVQDAPTKVDAPTATFTAAGETAPGTVAVIPSNDEVIVSETNTTDETPRTVRRTYKVRSSTMVIGSLKAAHRGAEEVEQDLRRSGQAASFIALRVVPVPYETVSTETYNQMLGYQEMANILNRAYELVLEDYTSGKPVASADMGESKQAYYKRAVDELKPKPQAGELTVPAEQVPPPDGSIDMAALKAAGSDSGEADATHA